MHMVFSMRFLINPSGDVFTYGNIQCANIVCSGTLTATNIYNNAQVDELLTNMASTYYVDSAIASKASTSYVDSALASAVLNLDAVTVNVLTIT